MSEEPIDEPMTEAEKKRLAAQAKRAKKKFAEDGHKGIMFSGVTNDPVTQALNETLKSLRIRNVN